MIYDVIRHILKMIELFIFMVMFVSVPVVSCVIVKAVMKRLGIDDD